MTSHTTRPLVAIYADESCLGNGREGSNPGAAAGVIEYLSPSGQMTRRDYWISEPATTNNRMALRSFIEAMRVISTKGKSLRVCFVSDSQYLVTGVKEWVPGWMRRGWRRKTGEIENLSLWKEAVASMGSHQIDPRWVRGHDGHPQNEYANHLAIRAAREQTSSGGGVPSGFEEWLAAQQAKGKVTIPPQPFPDASTFRAMPSYPPALLKSDS